MANSADPRRPRGPSAMKAQMPPSTATLTDSHAASSVTFCAGGGLPIARPGVHWTVSRMTLLRTVLFACGKFPFIFKGRIYNRKRNDADSQNRLSDRAPARRGPRAAVQRRLPRADGLLQFDPFAFTKDSASGPASIADATSLAAHSAERERDLSGYPNWTVTSAGRQAGAGARRAGTHGAAVPHRSG
jgi:hypothetical protein